MRRAWRRSARTRARVVLPTRRGPSITMKRGGCGPRCGRRARLAAEESMPGIVSFDSREGRGQQADYSRVAGERSGGRAPSPGGPARARKEKKIYIFILVYSLLKKQKETAARRDQIK